MNQQLLNTLVEQQDPEALYRRYRAAGELPYGAFGELFWESQLQEMQALAERVLAERDGGESQEIALELGNVEMTGWLQHVQQDGLLRWRPSILRVEHGMQLWLEHLVYCACGGEGTSRLYGRKDSCWRFPPVPREQAEHYLRELTEGYQQGMREPLILLPQSGGEWLKACYDVKNDAILWDEETQLKARNKLIQAWTGNQMVEGEGMDIWYQRLWRHLEPEYYEAIIREAQRYLLPLFRHHQP